MTIEKAKGSTVAQIVTANIAYARVFKKHGIDFCCGGDVNLQKVCEQKRIDLQSILQDLNKTVLFNNEEDYNSWPLDQLVNYIESKHHSYAKEVLPILKDYAVKAAKSHGKNYPQLLEIEALIRELSTELQAHLGKEENILFPYIKHQLDTKGKISPTDNHAPQTMRKPICVMEQEHDHAGDLLRKLASLTNNFNPPQGACNTFKALYHLLSEFESNMHIHVHLENNILFPKAIELEPQLERNYAQ